MLTRLLHRPLFVGAVLAIVALPLAWWFAWMAPEGARLASARATAQTDQIQKGNLAAELAQLVHEQQRFGAGDPLVKRFAAAFPASADAADLVVQVYNLANSTSTNLQSITDDSVTAAASTQYSTIPVSITVSGSTGAVNAFVAGLYQLPRLLTIQSLNLAGGAVNTAGGGGQQTASINATAYTTAAGPAVTTTANS